MELQQEIEIGGGCISPAFMRVMGRPFKIRLVKIHHADRRVGNGDGSGFENFVIERDGQFFLTQAGADDQSKFAGDGLRLRNSFASQGIHDWSIGQFNVGDNEPALKLEVLELVDVNHGQIQPSLTPVVHPKMILAAEDAAPTEL